MQPIIHKVLRKDKEKNGKCPVVLQVYYRKERKQIFTGLSIDRELWDEKKQEASNKFRDADHFNRMLKNKLESVEKDFYKQSALNGEIDLNSKTKQSRQNFYDYSLAYYDGMSNRASKHYINKCKAAIRDFKLFSGDLNFQSITPQKLKEFEDHLFQQGRARNTINFVFKKLKQPFAQANKEKVTDYNPFVLYKPVTYKQTKRNYLTLEEIQQIENTDCGELNYIRDYFCICCRTGLRFGDMKKFNKATDITINKGVERIILPTEKTDEIVSIKISPQVKKMLDNIDKPLPTNVHSNRLLRIVTEKAGLDKHVHWHMSRHAFAVNCRALKIPIDAIQKLLGHSNIRTTMIYSKIVDTQLDEYMDKWE